MKARSKSSTPVVMGDVRFTVYADGCVRVEHAPGGKFSPFASLLTGRKTARSVPAEVTRSGRRLKIRTPRFTLEYTDSEKGVTPDTLSIRHQNSKGQPETWYPGKADKGNFGTVSRSLDFWKHCGGPERYPVEGILSTDGGHFVADQARVYWNTKHGWPEVWAQHVAFDGYFFAYGNDYKSALRDFITVFGRIPMIPRWAFGLWYSRWYAYTDKEILGLVRRYRKENIPLDVMVIDTDWRDGWGGYDWSPKYFPNPRGLLKKLRAMDVRSSLNDHPGYDNYDTLPEKDSHIPALARRLGALPHQGQWACDWSRKAAVEAWKEILLRPFVKQGMDFWWVDGWIKPPFKETDCQLWANQHYYDVSHEGSDSRGLILSRWGGVGSHRFPVQFSGDTPSEWEMLKYQIEFTARSGGLGAAYWSHDIGGFFGDRVDEELFVRWVQFGAMSPMLRTHSNHGVREPWNYSRETLAICRKQIRIRYALAPYFYNLSREAHETGLPLVRPMYLEYSDGNGGALNLRHQYLLGRDLLVVPADAPGEKATRQLRKRAHFPDGAWYGLETGEVVPGMDDRWVAIPHDIIPTYARGGAIIPSQKVGKSLGAEPPREMQIDYFPDRAAASELELYEDDGSSRDHERGSFSRTRVTGRRQGDMIEVTIHPPKGRWRGMPASRNWIVRVLLEEGESVLRAEIRDRRARGRVTNSCLAGTVASPFRFFEVRLVADSKPAVVRLRMDRA